MKSWIEISAERLAANFRAVEHAAGPGTEVLGVIKADGYGHGAELVAPVLADAGARWLGVTDAEEGSRVRAALSASGLERAAQPRILVMCGSESADALALVAENLTPVVWTPEHVRSLETVARAAGQSVQVHLEVDTGMGRQGAVPGSDLDRVLHALTEANHVHLEGVLSHLACAEDVGSAVSAHQLRAFLSALEAVRAASFRPAFVHLANTSGVDEGSTLAAVREAAARLGARPMVRTGLALYGYTLPLEGIGTAKLHEAVQPALRWTTRVLAVHDLAAGDTVGYGATFTAPRPLRVALLPVGYADGFRRGACSGLGDGWVTVAGHRAPVVGRVSMNLTVVNVTACGDVQVGDEAVLLGPGVTAEDHSRWNGTIPYEILCGLRGHRRLV